MLQSSLNVLEAVYMSPCCSYRRPVNSRCWHQILSLVSSKAERSALLISALLLPASINAFLAWSVPTPQASRYRRSSHGTPHQPSVPTPCEQKSWSGRWHRCAITSARDRPPPTLLRVSGPGNMAGRVHARQSTPAPPVRSLEMLHTSIPASTARIVSELDK